MSNNQPSPPRDNALESQFTCKTCSGVDHHKPSCRVGFNCPHCHVTPDDAVVHGHHPGCPSHVPDPVEDGVYLVRASDLKPEHVDYFEDDLIPLRVVTLATGLDGVGKSTILYNKAALATRGKLPGKFTGNAVDVVIASSEDHPESVILPRLIAAGADLDRVHIVKVRRDGLTGEIALPDDLDAVAKEVGCVRARLLIVDPLVAHMPLQIDSHKAQHVRSVLAPLARLAEDETLAVAAVVHFNGSPSTDVRSRISGSKALRDAARSVLVCGVDPTDESRYVLVQDKFSFGPKPTTGRAYQIESKVIEYERETFTTSAVAWLGEIEIDSRGLLAGPGDPEQRNDIDRAKAFLQSLVSPGDRIEPREAEKAGKAAEGLDAKTLQRARQQLGWDAKGEGFNPKIWWWIRPVSDALVLDNRAANSRRVHYEETVTAHAEEAPESPVLDSLSSVSTTGPNGSTTDPDSDPRRFIDPTYRDHGLKVAQARADEVRRSRERDRAAGVSE